MVKRKVVSALVSALIVLAGIITTNLTVQASQTVQATRESFKVTVNYDLSLMDMIAAGKYNGFHHSIDPYNTRNFPIKGGGKVDVNIELIYFDKDIAHNKEVLRELDARGLRPATLPELLAFGATYPEKQLEFPIVALGFAWVADWYSHRRLNEWQAGYTYWPYLKSDGSRRILYLGGYTGLWVGSPRFAAVRK